MDIIISIIDTSDKGQSSPKEKDVSDESDESDESFTERQKRKLMIISKKYLLKLRKIKHRSF